MIKTYHFENEIPPVEKFPGVREVLNTFHLDWNYLYYKSPNSFAEVNRLKRFIMVHDAGQSETNPIYKYCVQHGTFIPYGKSIKK